MMICMVLEIHIQRDQECSLLCYYRSRHRGLEGKQATVNSEGKGSNPVANFFLLMQEREKREWKRARKTNLETKRKMKKRRAREWPSTRERARNRGLHPKLKSEKKRLDSKDVEMWSKQPFDARNTKHSRKRVAARNKGSWSSSPLNVTQAAGQ